MQLNIQKKYPDALVPTYGSKSAAGLDLYSYVDCDVPPRTRKLISTGITLSMTGEESEKYYLRIAPRSGLSVKNNIDVGAGVVDYDYRGEIFVCFINNDNENVYHIKKDDRIAQIIPTRIYNHIEVVVVDQHEETERGSGAFGSTGK
jgi:dUTP pyrophosphatase